MSAPYGPGPFQSYGGPQLQPPPRPAAKPQRPAMLTLSVVLIIAGSMLLMTELALVWLFVYIARDGLGYSGTDGVFYHMLERFHLQMLEGLAWIAFGCPGAAVVLSFFLLTRKAWPRIAISLLGAGTIVATAIVLSDQMVWVVPVGVYIAFAVVILWTPAVSAWCNEADSAEIAPGTSR